MASQSSDQIVSLLNKIYQPMPPHIEHPWDGLNTIEAVADEIRSIPIHDPYNEWTGWTVEDMIHTLGSIHELRVDVDQGAIAQRVIDELTCEKNDPQKKATTMPTVTELLQAIFKPVPSHEWLEEVEEDLRTVPFAEWTVENLLDTLAGYEDLRDELTEEERISLAKQIMDALAQPPPPPPEANPEEAFEQFYQTHYRSLPRWVNEELFKEDLKGGYLQSLQEARDAGKKTFTSCSALHPLISGVIDPGGYSKVDNYAFYFENPEQTFNAYTGQLEL